MASYNIMGDEGTIDRVKHTAIGQYIQSRLFLGLPIDVIPNTTLNQKFGINPKTRITADEKYQAIYFCIGDGGHDQSKTANQPAITVPVDHDPSDCALYHHMPFVLRPLNNDLTDTERSRYRLRRIENHGGVDYAAYYARKMTYENTTRIVLESVNKGVSTVLPYDYTERNLSPVRPELPVRQVVTASNTKMKVSTGASIVFDEFDVREYRNVCKIIYGSARVSVISEMCAVAAVDDTTYVNDAGQRFPELKGATVISFFSTYQSMDFSNGGFTEVLELGEKTPLPTNSSIIPTVGVSPTTEGVGG